MSETVSPAAARWPVDRVLGLAPDQASVTAARKLSVGTGWSDCGCGETAVWGSCAGSGRTPYRTVVDLTGPAYKCTCPSRKFPCKHSLGLLLRWAEGQVGPGQPPEFAQVWLESRADRADRQAARANTQAKPPDPVAQAKRAQARAERVTAGLAELDRWLTDQVRGGLAGLQAGGYTAFDSIAARMVDAQAPGVASWLRRLPGVVASGPAWPDRLLEELSLLRLLIKAHDRLTEFDRAHPALAATIRAHVGYPVSKEAVLTGLAGAPVRDRWTVCAVRDSDLDNLTQRTLHLFGAASRRNAVVLSFAAAGMPLDDSLRVGECVEADLHFYPGVRPTRALVGERYAQDLPPGELPDGSARSAAGAVSAALALDPWSRGVSAFVTAQPVQRTAGWFVVDRDGGALPLVGSEHWTYVSCCGGLAHKSLLGWSPEGWLPLSVCEGEVIGL